MPPSGSGQPAVNEIGRILQLADQHGHGHQLREAGFRSFFREHAQRFEVLETLVNLETGQVTYEATLNLLDRHPDIAGFYVAGGGMEGAIAALRDEAGIAAPSVVVNKLTPESTAALQDHRITAVIATPLPQLCRTLIDLMINTVRNGPSETPGQLFLPFNLHVPESM